MRCFVAFWRNYCALELLYEAFEHGYSRWHASHGMELLSDAHTSSNRLQQMRDNEISRAYVVSQRAFGRLLHHDTEVRRILGRKALYLSGRQLPKEPLHVTSF
jgi:hypothetical protein